MKKCIRSLTFFQVFRPSYTNPMPQHKRGPWSQSEDAQLLQLVNIHGAHNWVRISQSIHSRSPKQCRERFHQNLKPNLNHEPISPEEGLLIEQMVADMGKRWAEIARRLRGRSDNAVKNWWNGGMNRRRRSNHQRRTEIEVRHQTQDAGQVQELRVPAHQHPLPTNFNPHSHMPMQFFAQPAYHPGHAHFPQSMRLPSNGPPLRSMGMMDTPLPSPGSYSQMSTGDNGPPSLISDSSSTSNRSPHNGTSPIELPPLSGARSERRQSAAPMLQLGVPGSFVQDNDFQFSPMHMSRFGDMEKQQQHSPRVLQEPWMPQQQQHFAHPSQYLPSQPRHPSPLHLHSAAPHYPMGHSLPHQVAHPSMLRAQSFPQLPQHPQQAQYHHHHQHQIPSVQLPSISKMESTTHNEPHDSSPAHLRTPVPSAATPDGSPKDKMSLSNLTH